MRRAYFFFPSSPPKILFKIQPRLIQWTFLLALRSFNLLINSVNIIPVFTLNTSIYCKDLNTFYLTRFFSALGIINWLWDLLTVSYSVNMDDRLFVLQKVPENCTHKYIKHTTWKNLRLEKYQFNTTFQGSLLTLIKDSLFTFWHS